MPYAYIFIVIFICAFILGIVLAVAESRAATRELEENNDRRARAEEMRII